MIAMKWCYLLLLTSILPITGVAHGRVAASKSGPAQPPEIVTVKFTLLNAPGVIEKGSSWETAYELRIANEHTYYEANRQGKFKADSTARVGELISKGSFTRKSLRQLSNRKMVLQLPLSKEIQERLKHQPKDRIKLTATTATTENIKLSREQEQKAQVFIFYSIANFYDAKMKKNIVIPVTGIWMFGGHPKAQFEIKVEVTETGFKTEST